MLERFPRRADARVFVAVAVVAITLGAVALGGSIASIGRVFPGFVVWDNLLVVALGRSSWTGVQAEVPIRTRVLAVDDVPVATRDDLDRLVAAKGATIPHTYVFATAAGAVETRTVRAMRFSAGDWAATMGPYAVNGIVFLLTGLAVFWLKPESSQSRAVLAFGVCWGLVLLLLSLDVWTGRRLQYVYFLLEPVTPAAVLHLALEFPETRIRRRGTLVLLYAVGLAVGAVQVWAFWRAFPLLVAVSDAVNLAIAASGLCAIGTIAWTALGGGATPLARRRARVVLAGTVAAFGLPMPAYLAFILLGEPVSTNLLIVTGFVFPLAIGYAVARHDLFEADRFVKQSLVWATLTVLVTAMYAATVLAVDWIAAGLPVSQSRLFPIAFVLVALATIVPLRDRVQRALDRLFYRGRVDFKATIARASERMTTLLDRDAIVGLVLGTLRDVLFLEGVSLWERTPDGLVCRGGPRAGARIAGDDPGLVAAEALGRPLSRDEVAESVRLRATRAPLARLFDALEATLVVPLLGERRVLGWLAIGGKASGGDLSADDLDVLRTLANEVAVGLGTAAAVEQLQDARERLARSERLAAIGELSAAVAHGIRNPLAGIRLATQLGLEAVDRGESVQENLEDVLAEVDKLEAQVRGILDFARPFEPRLEAVDVPELVRSLFATLAPRFEIGGVALHLTVPSDLPPVLADRAHLGQAIQELLTNAADAMPTGGHVTVDAAVADGAPLVRIGVQDTGPGVTPEVRDRIFQLFMTTKRTGTGVGLAVVRKILERHGGRVTIDPSVTTGTRFVLELPIARATA